MSSLQARWPTALAVLVVLALSVGLAGAALDGPLTEAESTTTANAGAAAQPPNTTSYLHVPEDDLARTNYTQVSVDAPGVTAIDRDRLRLRLALQRFERRFEAASTSANRTATIRDITYRLENVTDRLQTRQSTAIERYNDREIGDRELFRALARVDASAQTVLNITDLVRSIDQRTIGYLLRDSLETRLINIQSTIEAVRDRNVRQRVIRNAIRGGAMTGTHVYVESGTDSFAIATILADNYVREGYAGAALDPNNSLDAQAATSRINDRYTWALDSDNRVSADISNRIGNTSVLEISINHVQGSLTAAFDASTLGVYHESQSKRLADVAPRTALATTNGSLALSVTGTHETGPMLVSLRDNATNATRDGTLYVDDCRIGPLGADGERWVVDTRATTSVRVVTEDGSVSVLVPEATLPG